MGVAMHACNTEFGSRSANSFVVREEFLGFNIWALAIERQTLHERERIQERIESL